MTVSQSQKRKYVDRIYGVIYCVLAFYSAEVEEYLTFDHRIGNRVQPDNHDYQ